jgi:hypothetical protein
MPHAPQVKQPAEELKSLSFRGALFAEESLFAPSPRKEREIPRSARNDKGMKQLFPQPVLIAENYFLLAAAVTAPAIVSAICNAPP